MKKLLLSLAFLPVLAFANPGPYLQGELGATVITIDTSDGAVWDFFSSTSGFGGRLSAGYLWGNNNFNYGLEVGGLYYPNIEFDEYVFGFDNEKFKYDGYDLDLLGVLKYTFNNGFDVFAKAGGDYVHQHLTVDANVTIDGVTSPSVRILDTTGSTVAPEVALGLGWQFNPHWEADLTSSIAFVGSASLPNHPEATTSTLLLGLTYHFAGATPQQAG
jgi:hypothetical protein